MWLNERPALCYNYRMGMTKFKTVDEYISSFPKDIQKILNIVRKAIREEIPGKPEEVISYSMPTFKLDGKYVVYFSAWKNHISLYPGTSQMEALTDLAVYRTGKGTFQFPLDKPLPLNIIRKIVKIRVKENLEDKKPHHR